MLFLSQYPSGATIFPSIAEAAATAAEDKNTLPSGEPCLPLKFLFEVERLTSPGPIIPVWPPRHGPQQGALTSAPASTNIFSNMFTQIYSLCR